VTDYVDCPTHGSKPWTFECICKHCCRVYRPQSPGQPDGDGPFVEMEFGFEPDQRFCECGEMLLDWSMGANETRVSESLGMICRKCFRDEMRMARLARIHVNDPRMLKRRAEERAARQS